MRILMTTAILAVLPALPQAAPITIDANGDEWEVFHYRTQRGPNSLGFGQEDRLVFGAVEVNPNGKGEYDGVPVAATPTTGTATQNGVTRDLTFYPTTVNPNQFGASVPYDPSLTGSWQLTFANGDDTLVVNTPEVGNAPAIDRVTNMRITSGANTTRPTFAWDPVSGIDSYKISIYDLTSRNQVGGVDRIWFSDPDGGKTGLSYRLPKGVIDPDGLYSIEVRSNILRTSGINPSGSSQAGASLSSGRTYFDFTLVDLPGEGDLFLPEVDMNSGQPMFNFNNPVLANQIQYYDPLVAVGYDYMIGESNPNFASFILPNIGDDLFDLYLWDGTDYIFDQTWAAGNEFFFAGEGVDRFRILGIETGAALNPSDPTAFVTGLSFMSSGRFTGTMEPITTNVTASPVPLPASLPLLLAAFGILGLSVRRVPPVA